MAIVRNTNSGYAMVRPEEPNVDMPSVGIDAVVD
jgi:hypothetical protein